MPAGYVTMADIAALYGVSPRTARNWAAADRWRRKGTRLKRYSVTDAQASYDKRKRDRTMRHLVKRYGTEEEPP
jgi:uncharacterized protein YjcR